MSRTKVCTYCGKPFVVRHHGQVRHRACQNNVDENRRRVALDRLLGSRLKPDSQTNVLLDSKPDSFYACSYTPQEQARVEERIAMTRRLVDAAKAEREARDLLRLVVAR